VVAKSAIEATSNAIPMVATLTAFLMIFYELRVINRWFYEFYVKVRVNVH